MTYYPNNPNGQATMANSSPVVIASNQSAVTVDLGANNDVTVTNATAANLKVDGSDVTQPVSGTVTANLSATDNAVLDTIASPVATVSATPLQRVAVFDASDTQITSFGGGTQYTEDAAAAANPVGNAMILVREDARAGSLTTTDGDNVAARGNNKGEMYVKTTDSDALLTTIDADTSSIATDASTIAGKDFSTETTLAALNAKVTAVNTGAVVVSSSALPSGASTAAKQPALGTAGTASADVITVQGIASMTALKVDGSAVTQPISYATTGSGTSTGAIRVELPTNGTGVIATVGAVTAITNALPAGTNAIGKLAANSGVDIGDVDITSVITGTGATNLGKAEDAGHSTGDVGVMALSVRSSSATALAGTNLDYQPLITDASGRLYATAAIDTALPAGTNAIGKLAANSGVDIGDVDVTSVIAGTGATNLGKAEDAAHSTGDTLVGIATRRIDTAASSSGTSGDYSTLDTSAEGAVWVTTTPTTTSGLSVANFTSGDTYTALTNSAQVIKASAGNLYGYYIYNPNSSVSYVMVYNVAAASVTVGTTTALLVFAIPATAGANLMFPFPITFSNAGWSVAAATTGGGNTAPSTALEAMFWYK